MLLTTPAHLPASSKDAAPVTNLLLRPLSCVLGLSVQAPLHLDHLVTYSRHQHLLGPSLKGDRHLRAISCTHKPSSTQTRHSRARPFGV